MQQHRCRARRAATAGEARIDEARRWLDDAMAVLRMAEAEEKAKRAAAKAHPGGVRLRLREALKVQAACEALKAMKAKVARRAKRERQVAAVVEATTAAAEATVAPAAPLRLDASEVTDSEADVQMAPQTPDLRAVLQACDAWVVLTRLGKLPEDDRSLEVERDRQHYVRDSGLNSIIDFNHDFDSAQVREGKQALRKAAAARDREAKHGEDCTRNHIGFGRGFGRVGRGDHSRLLGQQGVVPLTKLG